MSTKKFCNCPGFHPNTLQHSWNKKGGSCSSVDALWKFHCGKWREHTQVSVKNWILYFLGCSELTVSQVSGRLGPPAVSLIDRLVSYSMWILHCKKRLATFPSPAGMSLTKTLPGQESLNYSRPGRVWLVTSRLRMGMSLTFFNSEYTRTFCEH